jgi:hypothetical protein
MRFSNLGRQHISEAKVMPGSNEYLLSSDGHINAGSKAELARVLVNLLTENANGNIDTASAQQKEQQRVAKNFHVEEAWNDDRKWRELGSGLAGTLSSRMEREGFMRRLLKRFDVAEGAVPRIKVRQNKVKSIIVRGPGQIHPQFIRDRYLMPDEFSVVADVRVEDLDIRQGSSDILEDKFYEMQEAILVKEDRVLRNALDATAGMYNNITYYAGSFTPANFRTLTLNVDRWSIPVASVVLARDVMSDLLVGSSFSTYWDPVSKWEAIQTGTIGNLFGTSIITDGYREPGLKVLEDGEVYALGTDEYLGGYTDRGPVQSEPKDVSDDQVIARGWFMYEHISLAVANAKAVAKAIRS